MKIKKIIKKYEKFLFRKINLWLVILLLLLFSITLPISMAIVKFNIFSQHKYLSFIHTSLNFVATIPLIIATDTYFPTTRKAHGNFSGNLNEFKKGYILYSSKKKKISDTVHVDLINLKKNKIVHSWKINPVKIQKNLNLKNFSPNNFIGNHPLILNDGSLVLGYGEGPILRLDYCSNIINVYDDHFHHSIEKIEPNKIVTQVNLKNKLKNLELLNLIFGKELKNPPDIRNDGYSIINLETNDIKSKSFMKILIDNGYAYLLRQSLQFTNDPIHLNDSEIILKSDKYVKKGDVMFSSRHLSVIALYRPAENKIIWLKKGPFLFQHDLDYIGDGKFLFFGNDYSEGMGLYNEYASIYQYDMKNDKISVFKDLSKFKIKTATQGLFTLINENYLFVDALHGIYIIDLLKDKTVYKKFFYNEQKDEITLFHWSRYMSTQEVNKFKTNLKEECN